MPQSPLPRHIAIVMDGNGRWAEKRNRPRSLGHQAGLRALRRIVEHCGRLGIPELTVFAFSSENWQRPTQEINRLMDLFMRALDKEATQLRENGVQINFVGELNRFPLALREGILQTLERNCRDPRMKLNVAVNYGGRWDVTQAARALAKECVEGRLRPDDIDETVFAQKLMLADSPPPDLFIRTGGELRISNFLLWQCAYSEFYFSSALWPDFTPARLDEALADYTSRERRFGRTGEQARLQAG